MNANFAGADVIAILILVTILIAIGVYLLHWLYRRSSKNQSFVRTGFGGEKVVMGGGAFIIPIIHDITLVNMNAINLDIRRAGDKSLITKNKIRIDLMSEYTVRVIPTEENVSIAARTLGDKTTDSENLRQIIQARIIDAMSAVAASMTMEDIHQDRIGYMDRVKAMIDQSLQRNGLELEAAALTQLNQSEISVFNPSNAFDAEGLTTLTEQIEEKRKIRNQIENDTRISIKMKDYETVKQSLAIDRDTENARVEQSREIEVFKASQSAEVEAEKAKSAIIISEHQNLMDSERERHQIMKRRQIEVERVKTETTIRQEEIENNKKTRIEEIEATKFIETQDIAKKMLVEDERIKNNQIVEMNRIKSMLEVSVSDARSKAEIETSKMDADRLVQISRVEHNNIIRKTEIELGKDVRISDELATEEVERTQINAKRNIEAERISKLEEVKQLEIARDKNIKITETESRKAIDNSMIEANREVDEMRIAAAKFVERFEIEQNREVEIVDKERLIAVINKSIEEAMAKAKADEAWRLQAQAEEQIRTAREEETAKRSKMVELIEMETKTERDAMRIVSQSVAERKAAEEKAAAEMAAAGAAEVRYAKDAEGQRQLNEAENLRSESSRKSAIYENLVSNLPQIIRETVKPMENIDSIKILQVDGVPGINSPSERGSGDGGVTGDGGGSGNMTDKVVNSAMKYRTQVAFVDGLMKELGLPLENVGSAGGMSFRNFPMADAGNDKGGKDD